MIMDAPDASKSDQIQFLLVIKFLQKEYGSKIWNSAVFFFFALLDNSSSMKNKPYDTWSHTILDIYLSQLEA